MRRFGLIGYPLEHSFSKSYFSQKFENAGLYDCHYNLFPLKSLREFPLLLKKYPELNGLNVTIPYKQQVIDYLDELDETAEAIGAVNTIQIGNDQYTTGYNTDVDGFIDSIRPLLAKAHRQALIFGTGGAARAVKYGLDQLNISYKLVSRSSDRGDYVYSQLTPRTIKQHKVLINATPLGMHPDTDSAPALPYDAISSEHLLYDLVYNPEKTTFLQEGEKREATIKNGLEMLYRQAERSWEVWTNR
jgi:shikimate dehydrogenase